MPRSDDTVSHDYARYSLTLRINGMTFDFTTGSVINLMGAGAEQKFDDGFQALVTAMASHPGITVAFARKDYSAAAATFTP